MTSEEFEKYLESIGGLENGVYTNKPPIKSRGFFEIGDGWLGLVKGCIEELIALGWNKQICQVKEKFGGLRFYINEYPKGGNEAIAKYEFESVITCEICGKEGKHEKRNNWWSTLCDEHS